MVDLILFYLYTYISRKRVYPKSQCNFRLVKPDPVSAESFIISDTVGCRLRVQWQLLDTGTCAVKYNIEFKNNCDTILGNVTGIRNNVSFYCTDDYAESSSVTVWAVRKGVKGTKSEIALFATPKTIITDTKGKYIAFSSFFMLFFLSTRNQRK